MLDDINRRLLRELHANPRITMSALGRIVGMSAPAVTERVQRMERDGVITGYRVEVDPAALGLPVSAFTRVRPAPRELSKVAELAASLPQVSRVPPDHRRGLLSHPRARADDPGARGDAGPVSAVRADGDVGGGLHAGAAASASPSTPESASSERTMAIAPREGLNGLCFLVTRPMNFSRGCCLLV